VKAPELAFVAAPAMKLAQRYAEHRLRGAGHEVDFLGVWVAAHRKARGVAFVVDVMQALVAGKDLHLSLQRPQNSGMDVTVSDLIGMRTRSFPKFPYVNLAYTQAGPGTG